jgi:ribosomal protein L24E
LVETTVVVMADSRVAWMVAHSVEKTVGMKAEPRVPW